MALPAWNAGFSRHSGPQARGWFVAVREEARAAAERRSPTGIAARRAAKPHLAPQTRHAPPSAAATLLRVKRVRRRERQRPEGATLTEFRLALAVRSRSALNRLQ